MAPITSLGFGLQLAALLLGYWSVDWALRRRACFSLARRLGVVPTRDWLPWVVGLGPVGCVWDWGAVGPATATVRPLSLALLAALTWKATTRDVDLVAGHSHGKARLLLLASLGLSWHTPAAVVAGAVLLSGPLPQWQHHATLPMRLLQSLVAYLALSGGAALLAGALPAGFELELAPLVLLLLTQQASHYFITAAAKMRLGRRWYSWVVDNRLHHIAASAYSWGWARFLSWAGWQRLLRRVRRLERPLQAAVFAAEALAPFALLDRDVSVLLSLTWAGFHFGVFLLSGLLFWEWLAADLALAWAVFTLSPSAQQLFGFQAVLLASALMVVFPLRHKLWKPMPLGWFDSPFTQRIHWRVVGLSGQEYGLYNDFMCPHDRLYGKVHGCFFAPVPVVTYHLGEVWKSEIRDAIVAAGPSPEQLARVKKRFGIRPLSADLAARHQAYLRRFFFELNRGARKSFLPSWLRWLKAPGGQIYHWGDRPAYRRQEPVVAVNLVYREEYYDGEKLRRLCDDRVLHFEVGTQPPPKAEAEPTPKELDDFLLGFAAGRLIDIPRFAAGYLRADDGSRAA